MARRASSYTLEDPEQPHIVGRPGNRSRTRVGSILLSATMMAHERPLRPGKTSPTIISTRIPCRPPQNPLLLTTTTKPRPRRRHGDLGHHLP
uniref:Uncharacterized protein n=1 Tax=Arundo donax TaxID=35708 RepID=A0A0A8ZPC1_ARUDO